MTHLDDAKGSKSKASEAGTDPSPHDFLAIDSLLEEEELLLRSTVRRYVEEQILPSVVEWYERESFPARAVARDLADLGLLGMHLNGYGCAGSSATAYGLACLELEAGDSGLRSFVSVQGALAMFPIWAYGSEEQRERWLPRMASGEIIGCFALTEPDSGSDPSSMRTTAKRDGSDWVLNGTKLWITHGSVADVAVVWAQTEAGVRGFVVPADTPGFTSSDIPRKLSMRASTTSELSLLDVRLPADASLPGTSGMRGPLSCLTEARFGIAFGAVGAARACYEAALSYAGERQQFGGPISRFQLTQQKLVEMMIGVQRGTLLALHLGRLKDGGQITPAQVSFGKLDNVRMALETARVARSILGANGITLDYPVMRHMNNLETVYTYEGTHEIHTLVLGAALTGQSAFS